MRRVGFVVFLSASLLLMGCSTTRRRRCCRPQPVCRGTFVEVTPPTVVSPPVARAPVPYATNETTPWAFLAAKYDKDGDGKITPDERGRDEAGFERLDKDKDGALTEADFQQVDRMYQMIAQMTLLRYFQEDDEPRDLHREELQIAFTRHDANKDGVLSQAELTAASDAVTGEGSGRPPRMPAGVDPYGALLAVTDRDKSGTVALAELEVFFDARDSGGSGKWEPRARGAGSARPPGGVDVGEPAPDFTLRPPDGGPAVTLSDFKGKRPVALIFGSYT